MSSTELRCSSSLDYEGITFAMCRGTDILFRLPENVRKEVLDSGGKQDGWSNQEWVSPGNYHEHKRLVRLAYDYAVELAATRSKQTLESKKIITSCPNCSQKLRAPSHLKELQLTCPKCRHSWWWNPQNERLIKVVEETFRRYDKPLSDYDQNIFSEERIEQQRHRMRQREQTWKQLKLESASGYLLKEYHGRRGGLSIAFIRNGEVIDEFEIRGE
jgi:Zn-finger nucleic acid-binding protein